MNRTKSFRRLLTVLVSCLFFFTGVSSADADSYGGNGNKLNLTLLRPGDIIVFKGVLGTDELPGSWSHCGIYIGNNQFIDAWKDGVRQVPVSIVLTASTAAIYRVKTNSSVKQAAMAFSVAQLGKPYDFGWIRWPGTKDIKSSAWYCSELVWAAYKISGVELDKYPRYHTIYWNNVAPVELMMTQNVSLVSKSD